MKIFELLQEQRQRLAAVDTSAAAFKAGVLLRTLWELAKPILLWTALILAIGVYFTFDLLIRAAIGSKR